MKQSDMDLALDRIDQEISFLVSVKDKMMAVRYLGGVTALDEPKVRKTRRKRNVGLPSAAPPASEANHVKGGERL